MMNKRMKEMEAQLAELRGVAASLEAKLTSTKQSEAALAAELEARGAELIDLNAKYSDLESIYSRTTNELNSCRGELASAQRRLDEYRNRQESIVNALTDARETHDRIINDAKAEAEQIIASADSEKEQLLASAKSEVEKARSDAAAIRHNAETEARRIKDNAEEEAAAITDGAEKDALARIAEVDGVILEKREQLDNLKTEISVRAKAALEQTELYTNMLQLIAESDLSEIPQEECDFDCEHCENKCESYIPYPNDEADNTKPPCGRECFCCDEAECCNSEQTSGSEGDAAEDALEEVRADEYDCDENVGAECGCCEACAEDAEEVSCEEEACCSEECRECEPDTEPTIIEGKDGLGEPDYSGVASLMQNIYSIENRELPDELDDEVLDVGEGTPLVTEDEADDYTPLPVDDDLETILKSIL